ncbi:unnamed protein product [Adineta steineri]|uniref:Uncharacterized protein n=1 Tax=Adineta steineri TaxID=433720 RepID=A0A813WH76_9BILA|nr:unnamed protein product [Adineta steineri]CAF1198717.1 unnamed protein product [Adineta steineri]
MFESDPCNLLDIPSSRLTINQGKESNEEPKQQSSQPTDVLPENLHDIEIYEKKLLAFCGLWEDYPRRYHRMEFRIEMGQLVGYSNVHGSKAIANFDGRLIHMIILHETELGRPIDYYRGRLGWNEKYIRWEKEDSSRQTGWRSTRRWIRIE